MATPPTASQFVAHPVFLVSLLLMAACAAAPRQRPLPIGPPETGAGTTAAARQELQGRWTLVSLDVGDEQGRHTPVEADGVLSMDAFGNLRIELRPTDAGRAAMTTLGVSYPRTISLEGRVVIDPQQHTITFISPGTNTSDVGLDPALAARRGNPFAVERMRSYAIDADGVLTLRTRHDNGADAATSRWKRQ